MCHSEIYQNAMDQQRRPIIAMCVGGNGHLERYFWCAGPRKWGHSHFYWYYSRQGSPRSGWVKKGELQEGIGRSRGGRTSKVHVAVNAQGLPVRLAISGDQVHDSKMMPAFLDWHNPPLAIVADKAMGALKLDKLFGMKELWMLFQQRTTHAIQNHTTKIFITLEILLNGFLQNERYEAFSDKVLKIRKKFLEPRLFVCNQILGKLSPDPSCR